MIQHYIWWVAYQNKIYRVYSLFIPLHISDWSAIKMSWQMTTRRALLQKVTKRWHRFFKQFYSLTDEWYTDSKLLQMCVINQKFQPENLCSLSYIINIPVILQHKHHNADLLISWGWGCNHLSSWFKDSCTLGNQQANLSFF
jgi:hypothetical protein